MDHQDWTPVTIKKKTKAEQLATKEAKLANSQKGETIGKFVPAHDFRKLMMQARVAKKITQQELAKSMNLPLPIIRDWESGKKVPTNRQIANLERSLGTKLPRCKKMKIKDDSS